MSEWSARVLTSRPPWPRRQCILIIVSLVAAIGFADYATGFWVSLQVFYFLPVMLSVLWLDTSGQWATVLLCVAVRLISDVAAGLFPQMGGASIFWNRLAELCLYAVGLTVLNALVSLQHQLEERVRQRTSALEEAIAARDELQKQLFEIGRRERGAIGHDLHDGLGQQLTATAMAANLLAGRLATVGHPASDDARQIVGMLQDSITKTRQLARGLLLSAVAPANFVPELEELATSIREQHRIDCTFKARGKLHGVTIASTSQLFYIAREAAHNAARHADPQHILIGLSVDADALSLWIEDDGIGMPKNGEADGGMGLRIMRHRSDLIGAQFSVESVEPHGTRVRCRLPLPTSELSPS